MTTPPSRLSAQERIESPPDVRGWSVINEAQPRSYSQKHRTDPPRERSRVYARSHPEGVARMALKTPQEFVQSIADLHLQIYMLSLIHISEPTRLGMISYAVFCLKKK